MCPIPNIYLSIVDIQIWIQDVWVFMLATWFAQVVVGVSDPNPLVGGQGLQTLKDNGIVVDVGCLEDECYNINKDFMERMQSTGS